MRPGSRIFLSLVAVAAVSVPVASAAKPAAPVVAPAPQQLTLDAWQSPAQATWQKRTWQKTRAWCHTRVGGAPRWRTVLQKGKCGTVVASAPLAKGQTYQVTVKGLISHWRGTWKKTCGSPIPSHDDKRGEDFNASADAQWTFASKKGSFWCRLLASHLPTVGAGFRINADPKGAPSGWRYPWMGQSRTYVRSNHAYGFTVQGTGKPVYFGLYDHWVVDNYGSFDITVTPVAATT